MLCTRYSAGNTRAPFISPLIIFGVETQKFHFHQSARKWSVTAKGVPEWSDLETPLWERGGGLTATPATDSPRAAIWAGTSSTGSQSLRVPLYSKVLRFRPSGSLLPTTGAGFHREGSRKERWNGLDAQTEPRVQRSFYTRGSLGFAGQFVRIDDSHFVAGSRVFGQANTPTKEFKKGRKSGHVQNWKHPAERWEHRERSGTALLLPGEFDLNTPSIGTFVLWCLFFHTWLWYGALTCQDRLFYFYFLRFPC